MVKKPALRSFGGAGMHVLSFFGGIGLLDLGFEASGFRTAFVNEYDPAFLNAYRYARSRLELPQPEHGGDAADIAVYLEDARQRSRLSSIVRSVRKQSPAFGFIAGPPCPDFSIGGKNRGRLGERGMLSRAYIELVREYQPDFFLFENVKGMWKTRKHRVFYDELKALMHASGYVTTDRLINAIEFGAPQDRDRIILLGFHQKLLRRIGRGDLATRSVLPEGEFPWTRFAKYERSSVFQLPWPTIQEFGRVDLPAPTDVPLELTVKHWFDHNAVASHPNASHRFMPRAGIRRFLSVSEGDDSRKSFKRLHRWRYSPTCAYGNNEVHLHPWEARRISVAEALSLQSMPAAFELPPTMTLSAMFKTVGNGVPYLASKALAGSVSAFVASD